MSYISPHVLKEIKKPVKNTKPKKELTGPQAKLNEIIADATAFIFGSAEITVSTPFNINCIAFSIDNETIFYGNSNGNVTRYSKLEGKITDDQPIGNGPIIGICLDEINDRVIICGSNNVIGVYRLPRLEIIKEFSGHSEKINQICMDVNSEFAYSASDDWTVRKWALNDKNKTGKTIMTHEGSAKCLAVSHDQKYVFSAGDDSVIRVYDLEFEEEILSLQSGTKSVWSLACNYSSTMLASGSDNGSIVIWDIIDFTPINVLNDHLSGIRSLMFSPDDTFLSSGSNDSKIKVWDLDKDRREVTLNAHTGPITGLLVSKSQDLIISCSEDKNIKI